MALITLKQPIFYPGNAISTTPPIADANLGTLSGAGHYIAYVLQATEDMTISHVGWRVGSVTSSTADVRIETVGTDGYPTGTLWATNTNIVTGTLTGSTFRQDALTASATITRGQIYAVKIAYNSGTSFQIRMAGLTAGMSSFQTMMPYYCFSTGTPSKNSAGRYWWLSLGSSSTSFYSIGNCIPYNATTSTTFTNSGTTRRGVRFQVPFNCRLIGTTWYNNNNLGDYTVGVYNDAGTELSSSVTAMDGNYQSESTNSGTHRVFFDNAVSLTRNTWYRVAIEATSATAVNHQTITVPSIDYMNATPGGQNYHLTTWNGSAWVDTATTEVPLQDLLIDQIDDGTGSGGGGVTGVIGA